MFGFLKTEHHEKILRPADCIDLIPKIADFMDEPLADASLVPTYLLCQFTKEKVTVALAGDGGERKRLEDLSRRLYLGKKIVFLGERRDIPEILSCGDFLVLPSLMEGFGISIIEGYVFSLPAVGTRVGGIPEVIRDGETGFLVAPGNEISLASALGKFLLRPSERIEMGKKGRKFLEENFTYERFEKNVISLYRTISG